MQYLLLIFSQSDYFFQIVDTNSHNGKQCRSRSVGFFRVLHCLQRQSISGFSRTRVKTLFEQLDQFSQGTCLKVHFLVLITGTCLFKYIENFTIKNGIFLIKNSDIFYISVENIDCGYSLELPRRGGSYEYPQSMFLSRNEKYNVYPCKPQFYYIKVGFKGLKII